MGMGKGMGMGENRRSGWDALTYGLVIDETPTSVIFREAYVADVDAVASSRAADTEWGPADPRTASYLAGEHHPQGALPPRVMFVALEGDSVVGYVAGHLTRRYECQGELQYLWVAPEHRRGGVATRLCRLLAQWFVEQEATLVCVDVLPDNLAARSFYRRNGAEELNPHWLVWRDIDSAFEE
jgi:ribosomal protein S18 acetylase RimI-like enzyme